MSNCTYLDGTLRQAARSQRTVRNARHRALHPRCRTYRLRLCDRTDALPRYTALRRCTLAQAVRARACACMLLSTVRLCSRPNCKKSYLSSLPRTKFNANFNGAIQYSALEQHLRLLYTCRVRYGRTMNSTGHRYSVHVRVYMRILSQVSWYPEKSLGIDNFAILCKSPIIYRVCGPQGTLNWEYVPTFGQSLQSH